MTNLKMRTPAPSELLDAWHAGSALPEQHRISPLLHIAYDEPGDLGELSLGERDRLLIGLRELLFGETLRSLADCPGCGIALELTLPVSVLSTLPSGPSVLDVHVGDYRVECRALRLDDLVDAAATGSLEAARALLVRRAVLSAERGGDQVTADELPQPIVAAVGAALAESDQLADVPVPVSCDVCGASWSGYFDIASYLWHEIDAWARRLLSEVHTLAVTYGWTETDVLALPTHRRQHYLQLVSDG